MGQIYEVPGYGPVEFPDGATEDQIIEATYALTGQNAPRETAQPSQAAPMQDKFNIGKIFEGSGVDETAMSATQRGLERFGTGLAQFGMQAAQVLYPPSQGVAKQGMEALQQWDQPREQAFQAQYGGQFRPEALALAAEIIPSFAGGIASGAAKAPQFVTRAAQELPRFARGLAGTAGIFGKNAALGAAAAPLAYDPTFERSIPEKAQEGALFGGLVGTALSGLARSGQIPAKLMSMFGSEDEAKKIIPRLGDLSTSLGEAIESPFIKGFEDTFLENIPFSGIRGAQYKTGKKLTDEGLNLLEDLSPGYRSASGTTDAGGIVKRRLKDEEKVIQKESLNLYSISDDVMEKNKIFANTDPYVQTAKRLLKEVSLPENLGNMPGDERESFIKFLNSIIESPLAKDIDETFPKVKINYAQNLQRATSSPKAEMTQKYSVIPKGANFRASELKEIAKKEWANNNRYLSYAYNALGESLKEGIGDSVRKSGVKEAQRAFNTAEQFYAKKYAPFETEELMKFTRKDEDSDKLLDYFIGSGRKDRTNMLTSLLTKLPDKERKLIGRAFLDKSITTDADNAVNFAPKKLVNLYEHIPDRMRKVLFPESDFTKKMATYATRVKKNPSSAEALATIKTGYSQTQANALAGTIGGLLVALASGNVPAVAGILGTAGGSNLLAKYLRSPKARQTFLKGLQPMEQPGAIKSGITGAGAIQSGIPNQEEQEQFY